MKATSFIVAMIVIAMLLCSPVSAQTTATAATTPTTQVKTAKVAKPAWGLIYTKAEYDTLQKDYSAYADSEEVGNLTWGQLREILNLKHDQTLRDGDRRYVNMPGMYKHQVTKTIATKFDSVTTDTKAVATKLDTTTKTVNAVSAGLTKANNAIDDMAYFIRGLDESVTNLELVVTEDETQVPVPEGVGAVVRTEDKTMKACDAAMELIKKEVVARRAEAAKNKR